MISGINQWAFPAGMAVEEAVSRAAAAGFEAFEPCVGETGPLLFDITEEAAGKVRDTLRGAGLTIPSLACGTGWSYPLTSQDQALRDKGRTLTARALEIAKWLGAPSLLVVPGVVDAATPYDVALENAEKELRALVPVAEKAGVVLALENVWNRFLLSPVEMRDFIDRFDSPFVGAYLDVGNILAYGFPEQWVRILGERVRAVHAKDFRKVTGSIDGFVMLMEGDVNWPAVMVALRDAGFQGALTAEYAPYAHSLDTMLGHAAASLKTILAL